MQNFRSLGVFCLWEVSVYCFRLWCKSEPFVSKYCHVRCGVMIMDGSLLKQGCCLEWRKIGPCGPWALNHPFHPAVCHFLLKNTVKPIAKEYSSDVEAQRTGKELWKHKWLVLQKRPDVLSFFFYFFFLFFLLGLIIANSAWNRASCWSVEFSNALLPWEQHSKNWSTLPVDHMGILKLRWLRSKPVCAKHLTISSLKTEVLQHLV